MMRESDYQIDYEELRMLLGSNQIEQEYTLDALCGAIDAWVFLVLKKDLTAGIILEAHGRLMATRPNISDKWKGAYRTIPVYIRIPGQVQPEPLMPYKDVRAAMESLIEEMNRPADESWSDSDLVEWAKRCHIRFEKIHPFVDGNGRIGRMLYNWQRRRMGLHIFPITPDERAWYYSWFQDEG
jgi:Fic family protein